MTGIIIKGGLFCFSLLLAAPLLSAQSHKIPGMESVYFSAYTGLNTYNVKPNVGVGLTALIYKGWGADFSVRWNMYNPKNLPSDYWRGSFCLVGNCTPNESVVIYSLAFKKELIVSKSRKSIINFTLGSSLITNTYYEFFSNGSWAGRNYDHTRLKRTSPGFSYGVNYMRKFSSVVGMESGFFGNINDYQQQFVFQLSVLVGILNDKTISSRE